MIRTARPTVLLGSLATLTLLIIPSAAADSTLLAEIEVRGVAYTREGAARITGAYTCPSGYAPRDEFGANAWVTQHLRNRTLERFKHFASRVTCDGTRHPIAVKFRTATSGEAFHQDVALLIRLDLSVETSNGDDVFADDEETLTTDAIIATIEIRSIGFNDAGSVRLTGAYRCPASYTVESTAASVSQLIAPGRHKVKRFDRRVECDGTRNEVAVKFHKTRSGDPFIPDVPNAVQLAFLASTEDGALVQASDLRTLIIEA